MHDCDENSLQVMLRYPMSTRKIEGKVEGQQELVLRLIESGHITLKDAAEITQFSAEELKSCLH